MLDIYKFWFLILLANFLGLIYVLNVILYKPLLKIFQERKDIVKNSLDAAKEMSRKKEEGISRMSRELSDARSKAKAAFENMREDGLKKQKEILAETESKAAAMLQAAREELKAEAEKARQSLKSDVEKFSDEIVRKLVNA